MKPSIQTAVLRVLFLSAIFAACMSNAFAQAGISKNEIILGQSMDLSGPAAPRQKLVKEAADAYIKHINGKGGVNGRTIRVISIDNKGGKNETVADVKQLIEQDKVFALFLVSGTSNVTAILPYLAERRVPLFGITTGSVSLRKPHPYLFHYKASYADEAARIAEHLAVTGKSKVGIIYLRNGFGKEGLEATDAALAAKRIQVVARVEVAENASDYSSPAKMMADAKPQAVILVSVSGPAPKIVQAYRALDENALLYGLSILSSDAMYKALGDKVRGMIITQTVPYPWNRTNRVTAEYQDVMKATGVKEISVAGMEGFIAARMLVEALKTAGKSPTSESFKKVLENTGERDLGGYPYRYTAGDHDATHYVDITLIGKGGKLLR